MNKVAFFVDGYFMFKRILLFKSFFLDGKNIALYCQRHMTNEDRLYRIFYYDTPPLSRTVKKTDGTVIDFSKTKTAERMISLIQSIRETPNMALRLGKTTWQNDWIISEDALKNSDNRDDKGVFIKHNDLYPNVKQKTVDMKIGLDIATVTFKRLANRIVLIAGDSDFSPAAKLARTEGMHVTLDPLGNKVSDDLLEHVDIVCNKLNPNNEKDVNIIE